MNNLISSEFKEPNLLHQSFIFNMHKIRRLVYFKEGYWKEIVEKYIF
jgi:hypothetical protein